MAGVERIMAEGQGPGPESASAASAAGAGKIEGQTYISDSSRLTPQKPWRISSEFDSDRAGEYIAEEQGEYNVLIDPTTGKEVARALKIAGSGIFNKARGRSGGEQSPGNEGVTPTNQGNTPEAESTEPIQPSVPGLTAEEVRLFLASGYTPEELLGAQKQLSPERFREEADKRLQMIRDQQTNPVNLTPNQLARQEAEQRAKRVEQLTAEQKDLNNMPTDTEDQRRLRDLRQARVEMELNSLSGGAGGGGEREGGAEGPPEPPDRGLEYEASPERGRQIVEEIVKWEGLRAAGRLSEVNWERLDQLYLQHEIHVEAARIISLRINPTRPRQSLEEVQEILKVNLEGFNGFKSLAEWITEYTQGEITDEERFKREVDAYFEEAKRIGLLKDLDAVLLASYREVRQGIGRKLTSDEIMYGRGGYPGVEDKVQKALNSLIRSTRNQTRIDSGVRHLARVGELYAQFALDRFASAINTQDQEGLTQEGYLDHEFHLGQQMDGQQETFWRATHGWYIEVYAETPEEFMIAADSYISTLESITADPKKILDSAAQFVEVLSKSDGAQKLLQSEEGRRFINGLILQMEGRVGTHGADDQNERYERDNYKAYMDYTNKDGKGPDRYLELAKMLDGRVAAVLWKLDNDPRWEILFATYGSRGQLAKASFAQRDRATDQGIYNQVYSMLVEEMLGVQIRNKADFGSVTAFMPDRKFVAFFDGLYRYDPKLERTNYGDANIKAWNAIKDIPHDQLTPAQKQSKRNGAARLGRIQQELKEGKKLTELSEVGDQAFYSRALTEAKKAVDVAFQLYGAFGEKSKRAGGVFKTAEKTDAKGKKYQYFVPIHWAEKWVQFAETMTKIQYADLSAKDRAAKVKQVRDRNIEIFKRDGFEAKMVDADGKPMKFKRPKEDPNAIKDPDQFEVDEKGNVTVPDELARDSEGKIIKEPGEVEVDFYTATHHAYANWSGHTYWSYQEEDRQLLLSPSTFYQARQIRAGILRPEDADPVAVQLLILDPTLKRVKRFEKNFEDRERKLTMAAVEDSYQSHWRITRELYRAFWPKYGTPAKEIGIYYGLQDYGGYRKTIESMRARIAEDPERFSRRGRRLLPDLHNPVASLPEYLGQGTVGILGAIRMMGYPPYRLCGTFALDKFSANSEVGGKMIDALVGYTNREGKYEEGLLLKLTNNSDKLRATLGAIPLQKDKEGMWIWMSSEAQNKFCYELMESLGRLNIYEQLFTLMETQIRNASGALWLENVDIMTGKGTLTSEVESKMKASPEINWVNGTQGKDLSAEDLANFIAETDKLATETEDDFNKRFDSETIDESSVSTNTGSGRHSAKIFHDTFGELLVDEEKRGGVRLYPGEASVYQHIFDRIVYMTKDRKARHYSDETIWDFVLSKFVPT